MKNSIIIYCLILFCSCNIIAQTIFEQSVSINNMGSDPHLDCSLDVESDHQVIKVPALNTAARDLIASPVEGMLLFNTDEAKLQGYTDALLITEPETTYPYSNGSSNLFAFTVIVYTPTQDGLLTEISVGIGATNSVPAHRLVISDMKPCGTISNRARQKSSVEVYTDYITLLPNTRNFYTMSTPLPITAGTKYYIYPDPMTNNAGPRILWSDTGVQNIPSIGYINTSGVCSENLGDVDAKFIIETSPAGWVNLND